MFGDGSLTLREFAMREPLPLATIHDAVLEFLRGRVDAVLFGAQAVNAYVDESRMTQDVDILSTRAAGLAEDIRRFLNERFKSAVRVREIRVGLGSRVFQLQKPKNRHLVDVRPVTAFPPTQRVDDVLVVAPDELIANKLISWQRRIGLPKAFTARRDLAVLLLRFPELKTVAGPVRIRLEAGGASESDLTAWAEVVAQEIRQETDSEEFE